MSKNQYKVVQSLPGIVQVQCVEFHQGEALPGGMVCNHVNQTIWITDRDMSKMKPGNTVQVP